MEFEAIILVWYENWSDLYKNIIWSDEVVFHTGGFVNRQNCHNLTSEKMKDQPKITVWYRLTSDRILGLFLIGEITLTYCKIKSGKYQYFGEY